MLLVVVKNLTNITNIIDSAIGLNVLPVKHVKYTIVLSSVFLLIFAWIQMMPFVQILIPSCPANIFLFTPKKL